MSEAPTFAVWAGVIVALGLGVAAAVVATAIVAAMMPSGVWRRMAWQVGTVSLILLVGGELTGVARGVVEWSAVKVRTIGGGQQFGEVDWAELSGRNDDVGFKVEWPYEASGGAIAPNELFAIANADLSRGELPTGALEPSADVNRIIDGWSARSRAVSWWPGVVWLLGTCVVLTRVLIGRALLGVFRRRHRLEVPVDLTERVRTLARRIGLRCRVRVMIAEGLSGPIAFGTLRPTVGLSPQFVERHERAAQDAMLAHELAHLVAHDPAWQFVADLATATLWWHPLVWWLRREFRAASELAADEASLVVRDGPSTLAACLVELGSELTRVRPAWVSISGSGLRSNLARRVERLLTISGRNWHPPGRLSASLAKAFGPAALVVVSLLSTGWAAAQHDSVLQPSKGDPMIYSIQNSWRHSLAAVTLVSLFGAGDARAATAPATGEPIVAEASTQKDDDGEKKARQDKEAEVRAKLDESRAKMKEKFAALEREIDELRAAGKADQADKLVATLRELGAALEKAAADKGEKGGKGEKKPESGDKREKKPDDGDKGKKSVGSMDELRDWLKKLEGENAELRAVIAGVKTKASADQSDSDRAKAAAQLKLAIDEANARRGEANRLREQLKTTQEAKDEAVKREFEKKQEEIERKGKAEAGDKREKKPESADKVRKSDGSVDELRERLKMLDAENAKLREALGRKDGKESGDKSESLKVYGDKSVRIYDLQTGKELDQPRQPKGAEGIAVYKALEFLKGQNKEIEAGGQQAELGAVLKELREEVSRLRDEVSELRQIVKTRGTWDPKPMPVPPKK